MRGSWIGRKRAGRGGLLIWALMTRVWRCHAYVRQRNRCKSSARSLSLDYLLSFHSPSWQTTHPYRHATAPASVHALIANHLSPTGPTQVRLRLLACHPRLAPSIYRFHSPRGYICTRLLLFHVRPALLVYYLLYIQESGRSLAPRAHSLPKEKVPVRETAVATTASLLGGFGVVALFCSAGVYL